jgi:hypothetical protein
MTTPESRQSDTPTPETDAIAFYCGQVYETLPANGSLSSEELSDQGRAVSITDARKIERQRDELAAENAALKIRLSAFEGENLGKQIAIEDRNACIASLEARLKVVLDEVMPLLWYMSDKHAYIKRQENLHFTGMRIADYDRWAESRAKAALAQLSQEGATK